MKIDFSKGFNKQFEKLPQKRQEKARAAIALYLQNPKASSLRLHDLQGKWPGHHSLSAGGDLHIHFKMIDQNTLLFVAIGSHSQLYK
jgi:addiction module RelE/StbE family toxin